MRINNFLCGGSCAAIPAKRLFALAAVILVASSWPASAILIDRWRAEDIVLNDGDAVGSWTSISNRTVSGATGLQPILKQNITPAGGPVVRFNQSFMTTANSPFGGATAFSIAIVFKPNALGAALDSNPWYQWSGLVDAEQPGVTNDWGTVFNGSGHVGIGIGNPDTTLPSSGTSLLDGNFHVAVFTWGGGLQAIYVDNRAPASASSPTAARMNAGFAFGGILTTEGGAARRFIGDMAEVCFYNTSLSALEASNVIAGLTEYHIIGTLPVIRSFSANTNQLLIGSPVSLSWVVKTNSNSIFIDNGVGFVTGFSNSVLVVPRTNTTYTLTTSNAFGIRSAQVTVSVDQGIPVAQSQQVDTPQGQPIALTLTGSDPQGSNLTFTVVNGPFHGALSGTPPQVTYSPDPAYQGNDQFSFQVNDGEFDSPPAAVVIRVLAPPTAPSAIVLTTTTINNGTGPGAFLASIRAIDINPDDTHTFELSPGVVDNALFAITGNQLSAGATFAGGIGSIFTIRIRATDNTGLWVEQDFLLSVQEIARGIVINEIHYNPGNNTLLEEFIELHNPTTNDVDISYWRLANALDYAFGPGTVIPAGGYLVVAHDPPTILSRYGVTALGPWNGGLNNEGERVTLLNANSHTVNEVDYGSEFPWPIGANGGGGSMALVNPSLDNDLGSSWRTEIPPSPGARNAVFATNAAPNLRQVHHTPQAPNSTNSVVITVKVTDPEGVSSVQLQYQVITPGNYLSAIVPLTVAQLNALNTNPLEPSTNAAFESPSNWITVPMLDDGTSGDEVAGDNIYSVTLPPQANRVLVRYRIVVTDSLGATRRAPFEDDPSLNFAYFVYDGVPAYAGVSSAALQTLPVYFLVTRSSDFDTCAAYNGADQLPQFNGAIANEGRYAFNWEGAFVYDGQVYDHVRYRTQGANGRYYPGKHAYSIAFNDGRYLAARDQDGNSYPKKWSRLNIAKGASNRQTLTFSLNEALSYFLWNKVSVPSPLTHHMHWRLVRSAQEQPDLYNGDFYGIFMIQENYDVRFLDTHNMPKGNLYKLINAARSLDPYIDMQKQQRYQAPLAATNGADAVNIQNKLTAPNAVHDTSNLLALVNYPNFYRYHAIVEAVRDYDFWPNCNKNAAWYFEPAYGVGNNFFGRHWTLPWDATDTWGPTWNGGEDMGFNGIFSSSYGGGDAGQNLELQVQYFNTFREVRDLLIQPDQINPLIDAFAGRIAAVMAADLTRWSNTASSVGATYTALSTPGPGLTGGLGAYAQDLKDFMFVGGTRNWWIDRQTIGAGGWAASRLDTRGADPAYIPARPTLAYFGLTNYPVTDLVLGSSVFSDPQGAGTFAAMQWRVAEITPTNTPVSSVTQLKFEWDAVWDSGEMPVFTNRIRIPAVTVVPGRTYRARVRHKDRDGHWSNWSAPLEFVPSPVDIISDLQQYLVVSEFMYNPTNQGTISGDEFEFLELKNTGPRTLDLSGLSFTAGITFTFPLGTVLAPGQFFVLGRNVAQLQSRYPSLVVNGVYTGKLANEGETITLTHPYGTNIFSITYSDRAPWPVAADGYGFSLVMDATSPVGYRASTALGGSPGADDPPSSLLRVLVNEVLSSALPPALDAIELYNPGPNDADIGGWFLTDDATYPWKYRIADGTLLPAGCYVVFTETDFNSTLGVGTSFGISSLGEQVYLFSGNAAHQLTGYSHGFAFGGAAPNESFGRYLNSLGEEQFPPQLRLTLGTNNAGPRVGPVVINEIQYHPNPGGDPFVELLNITPGTVQLFDPANPTNTWKFNGLGYTFPTNVTLSANGLILLVATNPADFRAKYGVPPVVQIFGPYPGTLQHGGERLELQGPGWPTTNGVPYYTVDGVRYDDAAPWPIAADGWGASLLRKDATQYGDDPTNWFAAVPTPGAVHQGATAPVITSQPQSQTLLAFTSQSLSVVAAGDGPFAYQWLFYGTNLAGATDANLNLPNLQPSQAGPYAVYIFNPAGSVLSDTVNLTVLLPVAITQQPQTRKVLPGVNATFSVAAVGNGLLTYQWRFNGSPIDGATNSSLTISNAQLANDGLYDVVVTDAVSSASSETAALILLVKPIITQQPTPTNVVVRVGDALSLSISASGRLPISYRWRRNGGTLTNAILNETTSVLNFPSVQLTNAADYDVVVTNIAGAATPQVSPKAYVTVVAPPDSQSAPAGSNLMLRAILSSPRTFTNRFSWLFNSTNILLTGTNANRGSLSQQFTNDLLLTNLSAAQAGSYTYLVSNAFVVTNIIVTTNPPATNEIVVTNIVGTPAAFIATVQIGETDSDGDGIPDWWMLQYFGHATGQAGDHSRANDDADDDGMNNQQEFLAGTDPTDPSSLLKLTVVSPDGLPANSWAVEFTAISNKSYSLESRGPVGVGAWSNWVSFDALPSNRVVVVTNAVPSGPPTQLMRVRTPKGP